MAVCCLICFSFLQGKAGATQVTLTWTAETGVAGYKIYSGLASGAYQWVVNVGNATSYTTGDLTAGYTYYFAATAYDSSGLETDYSGEVSYAGNGSPGACVYSISPGSSTASATGGSGTVAVSTQSGCAWTAVSGASWISIASGASGTGSGTVGYTVSSNSGSARTAVSTIAGQAFTLAQSGLQSFVITPSAGTGGSISPSAVATVNYGASQTFTITPNSGYAISNVTVDGASVGAVSSYTFSNVVASHTIAATFAQNTYTLTVSTSGTGTGSVTTSPTGTTFTAGTLVTLTAAPNANSTFTGWSGACSGTSTTCQVTMNANTSVSAAFTLNATKTYAINASATGSGGYISPSGTVYVNQGGSKTFSITPRAGYRIRYLIVDSMFVTPSSSYTFSNVQGGHTIKAYFGR